MKLASFRTWPASFRSWPASFRSWINEADFISTMKLFEVGSAKSPSSFLGARLRHLGHIVPTDLLAGELSAVCGDYHAGIVLLTRYTIPYPGPFARNLCSLLLSTPALSQTRTPLINLWMTGFISNMTGFISIMTKLIKPTSWPEP